jgi:hypothetical protein
MNACPILPRCHRPQHTTGVQDDLRPSLPVVALGIPAARCLVVTWLELQHVVVAVAAGGSFGMTLGLSLATWQDSRGSLVQQQGACRLRRSKHVYELG